MLEWNVKWDWDDEEYSNVCFKLGHNEDICELLSDPEIMEFMDQQGVIVTKEKIQIPDRLNVSFFLGFAPNNGALEDICNALKKKNAIKKL